MQIIDTFIPDVKIIVPRVFNDERGAFSETYKKPLFDDAGFSIDFVQDNRSHSVKKFTIRGLHYQAVPHAQAKLVSVQAGRIFDVAVDLRRGSPTFLRHVGVELSAAAGDQIFIPSGFAHGFCTLEPDSIVTYKVDSVYAPDHEMGLHWRTADLAIEWPCGPDEALLSPKDLVLPDRVDPARCFP